MKSKLIVFLAILAWFLPSSVLASTFYCACKDAETAYRPCKTLTATTLAGAELECKGMEGNLGCDATGVSYPDGATCQEINEGYQDFINMVVGANYPTPKECKSGEQQQTWKQCILDALKEAGKSTLSAIDVENCTGLSCYEAPVDSPVVGLEGKIKDLNQIGTTDANKMIGRIIKAIMGLMGTVSLILFVYGGVLWMTAAGNSERAGEARKILIWTSLGMMVILGSYGIVDFIFKAFE
ncbi:MAG: hypothetical protein US42_C0008G0058 [Candidatus Magasanikbacteria bacterium GW2011_GWC2_37_14]|uniref:Uncharacterized protein n=1 Tax=Candidatus Magasanikbacteria bacterium GW2011_GWC2_37_14 TaxID=1619046 RepID=A0A0G0GC38_9BACT|nr:MAG: hypothetical protein US42_C0008G0058 [Candidatus Magasanikbacteria bacterium GW2011_GWC2_37_14]